jgi:hypothetical protein
MLRSKWRYLIVAAPVAAILGGGLLATAWRRLRPVLQHPAPTLAVRVQAPGGGVLAFSAVAKGVWIDGRGPAMVWYVEAIQDGESPRRVWWHNYDEMSVTPGATTFGLTRPPVDVRLPEQVIPGELPAGTCQLFVVLRDIEDTVLGPDGLSRPERMTITHLTEPFEVR